MSLSIHDLLAGTPYAPVKRLGAGGMGEVYAVRSRSFGKLFALKVLHPHCAMSPELVLRMRQEAHALGRLEHPNVVDLVDYWTGKDGRPCIVTELLDGRTLARELHERVSLPPVEAVEIVCQALEALSAAHALGMAHRDLKPENLYLHESSGERVVKVLDFGVVRMFDGGSAQFLRTNTGAIVGSPLYMSPEQAAGRPVDHRTDIFAMGMVLYVALAGRGPFDDGASSAPPPSQHAPVVPPVLDAVVLRAIRTAPEERYQRATELLRDLRAIVPAPAANPFFPR